jgi:hypothetical protein
MVLTVKSSSTGAKASKAGAMVVTVKSSSLGTSVSRAVVAAKGEEFVSDIAGLLMRIIAREY